MTALEMFEISPSLQARGVASLKIEAGTLVLTYYVDGKLGDESCKKVCRCDLYAEIGRTIKEFKSFCKGSVPNDIVEQLLISISDKWLTIKATNNSKSQDGQIVRLKKQEQ